MSTRASWDRLYEKEERPWKGASDEMVPLHGTVLELGIGNGKNLSSFPPDAEVIGLDFSRPALLSCSRKHREPLVQAEVTALPFRDGSVDNVAASHILGHLKASSRTMVTSEIERVLRNGGIVYVSVFGEEDMRFGKGEEVEQRTYERGNGIICHYFLQDEVPALFPRFRVVRAWERRLAKRYHGREEIRQERRFLLLK